MQPPLRALGREPLSNGWTSQTNLCSATGLPFWKISRLFSRLELLGFVEVEKESRFTRGRPRKFGGLIPRGIDYFAGLLGGASDEDYTESLVFSAAREVARRR